MAMSKTAGETKAKAEAAAKKEAAPKATTAKKAAPKKSKPATKAAPKAAVKKAAPKKVAAPKLSPTQQDLLETIKAQQPYLAEKKPDQKVVEALLKRKLVKKTGKKDEKTKSFHVALSQAGEKFLKSSSAPSPKA
jgi:adenylate kinase